MSKRKESEDRESHEQDDGRPNSGNKNPKHPEGTDWVVTCHKRENAKEVGVNDLIGYANYPHTIGTYGTQRSSFKITYLVYQEETAPSTGQLHLQMFFITDRKVKRSTLENAFPGAWFLMRSAEFRENAADYCRRCPSMLEGKECPYKSDKSEEHFNKDRTGRLIYEGGQFEEMKPGKRNDLHAVLDMINSGSSIRDIAGVHGVPMMRYGRGIERVHQLLNAAPNRGAPIVVVLWGNPGTGKSALITYLLERYGMADSCYRPASNNSDLMSFETYVDEQAIYLEDFDGRMHLSAKTLKTLCDRGKLTLPGRGVSQFAQHQLVFITSNRSPSEWGYNEMDVSALERRFAIEMEADYDTWTVHNANQELPPWMAEVPCLNSSNSKFENVAVYLIPELKEMIAREKQRFMSKKRSATSKNFILPKPIVAEPEPVPIPIYDDDFDLSPRQSVTQRFIYDLTQDE